MPQRKLCVRLILSSIKWITALNNQSAYSVHSNIDTGDICQEKAFPFIIITLPRVTTLSNKTVNRIHTFPKTIFSTNGRAPWESFHDRKIKITKENSYAMREKGHIFIIRGLYFRLYQWQLWHFDHFIYLRKILRDYRYRKNVGIYKCFYEPGK